MSAQVDPVAMTQYQVMQFRKEEQREKARLRMAKYRLRLKSAPPEEREESLSRARAARARYREKNREQLLDSARCKRIGAFGQKFGLVAFEAKIERRVERRLLKADRKRRKSRPSAPGKPKKRPPSPPRSTDDEWDDGGRQNAISSKHQAPPPDRADASRHRKLKASLSNGATEETHTAAGPRERHRLRQLYKQANTPTPLAAADNRDAARTPYRRQVSRQPSRRAGSSTPSGSAYDDDGYRHRWAPPTTLATHSTDDEDEDRDEDDEGSGCDLGMPMHPLHSYF
ncbi:hypothetical protein C8R47DRAFT_1228443 [Mycena vitilis]|nr:hypothetical protein C8R47DRAFT_1228443 [Mycena vitilis]